MCIQGCTKQNFRDNDTCKKHYVEKCIGKTNEKNDNGDLLRFCTKCSHFKIETGFRNKKGGVSKLCAGCIEKSRAAEARRKPRDRLEQTRLYEQREDVQEKRKQYRDTHHEQNREAVKQNRLKHLAEDREAYNAKRTQEMRNWRATK